MVNTAQCKIRVHMLEDLLDQVDFKIRYLSQEEKELIILKQD